MWKAHGSIPSLGCLMMPRVVTCLGSSEGVLGLQMCLYWSSSVIEGCLFKWRLVAAVKQTRDREPESS